MAEHFAAHPQIKENIFHVSTKGDMIMALELCYSTLQKGRRWRFWVFTDLSYMTGIPNYKKLIESLHTYSTMYRIVVSVSSGARLVGGNPIEDRNLRDLCQILCNFMSIKAFTENEAIEFLRVVFL